MLKKEIRRLRVYYEDWGSHRCAFGNVCAEHEGGEESHMGCGLQGVLHREMVKSHGGHQCLWCDTHHKQVGNNTGAGIPHGIWERDLQGMGAGWIVRSCFPPSIPALYS